MIARLLALAALPTAGCDRQSADAPQGEAPAGARQPAARVDRSKASRPAPDATFEAPDGELTSLDAFAGRPMLVNLWATWCAPCVQEMPSLDRLAAREAGRLHVVTISQDFGGREVVARFFEQGRLVSLDPFRDPGLALMPALGVDVLPTTILYDAMGREVWRVSGAEDWQSERSRRLLAEALSPEAAR